MSNQSIKDGASVRAVLSGITTPISDITIRDAGSQSVLAIVSTQAGIVSADIAAGAQVQGSGSHYMIMSGTTAQITATLSTLAYSTAVAGYDRLSVTLLASSGAIIAVMQTPLAAIPVAGRLTGMNSLVSFDNGTMTLESQTLDGPDLALTEPAGSHNATSLVLVNSTIGAESRLTIRNENATASLLPRLAIAGRVEFDGETGLHGSGTAVSLARGATLSNKGSMTIDGGATRFTGGGTFVNDGVVRILGGSASGGSTEIATALTGSGTVALAGGATLRLSASVAIGETIRLDDGANILHLTQPGTFDGTIAGFSTSDTLVLDGIAATDALYTPLGHGGVVSIMNGALVVASIRVNAPEAGSVFRLTTDSAGSPAISLTAATLGTVDVYRFFDTTHGTQLLTQAATERDTILTTRADLHYEGVALHAVDPAHTTSNAVDVYRFFDTGNGTHFMTSSTSERDTVLASRPDLAFEPGSTMLEDATAREGDAAVFRFFDNATGAHFYTADAGERASILATRPDMTPEGVAFYAPTT